MSGFEHDTLILIVETHAQSWDALVDAAKYKEHALTPSQYIRQVLP